MVVKDEEAVAYRKTENTYPWRGLKVITVSAFEIMGGSSLVAHP